MINVKKSLLKIRYLEEEYNDCQEICDKAKREIENVIRKTHSDLNVFDKDLDKDAFQRKMESMESREDEAPLAKIENPPWAKKLFRKIVMITHPDKVPESLNELIKDKFLSMYQKSKSLIDEGDYVGLIMIASDLNIDLSLEDIKDNKIFKKKQKDLEKKITQIKRSIYWSWTMSSDQERDEIIKDFIKQRGWTSKESMRKKSRKGSGRHPGKSISWARSKVSVAKKEDT